MVGDREKLMQLLWLLLSPDIEVSADEFSEFFSEQGAMTAWGEPLPGLLERMLETLVRDPRRLQHVATLIDDLRGTQNGTQLLDDEFLATWNAIWTAARKRT